MYIPRYFIVNCHTLKFGVCFFVYDKIANFYSIYILGQNFVSVKDYIFSFFSILGESLLLFIQLDTLLNLLFKEFIRYFRSVWLLYSVQSSANEISFSKGLEFTMSFIYYRKSKGPSMDP